MLKTLRPFVAVAVLLFGGTLCHAVECAVTVLSALGGQTCNIGTLQFTFGWAAATDSTMDLKTSTFTQRSDLSNTVRFVPYVNGYSVGFTFLGLPSTQMTGENTWVVAGAFAFFEVTPLSGHIIGPGAQSGGASATAWGIQLNGAIASSLAFTSMTYSTSPTTYLYAGDSTSAITDTNDIMYGTRMRYVQSYEWCAQCTPYNEAAFGDSAYIGHFDSSTQTYLPGGIGGGLASIYSGTA